MDVLKPDICIIGGGSAGRAVAAAAAVFGVPTVLVDNGKMGGGLGRRAFCASAMSANVDFAAVRAHVQAVIAATAPERSAARFTGMGVHVIKGHAAFQDKRTLGVDGKVVIRARRFVIATGSTPASPLIPGLDSGPYFTRDTIADIETLPAHLIVIGGEPDAIELAQAFRRLGSMITLCDAAQPLPDDDPECAAIVLDQVIRDGVFLRSGVLFKSIAHSAGKMTLTIEGASGDEKIEGTHLLVANGRKATVDGLNLQTAGIRSDTTGIIVNGKLKTSNRRVYAIGACAAGQLPYTHAAEYQAGLVIRHALFRQSVTVNNDVIPRVTLTQPEVAQVGLSEAEARKRRYRIRILRQPYQNNDRAQAEGATHGHIKVVTTTKGVILGVTIVGRQASELIATWTLAITEKLNIRAMTGIVMPYPTLSEIGKRAAGDFLTPSLTRPIVRRIIRSLRTFG